MTRLSYEHGAFDKPLIGETIGHNLERTVARNPDGEALVSCHQGVRYSYAEFNEAVDRLASGMLAGGLSKGDRVGVWSTNCAEWALVQYATAKLGVILVNINPSYRVSELEYALGQSGCRWVVAIRETRGSDFVEMVEQVRPAPCRARAGRVLRHARVGGARRGRSVAPRRCAGRDGRARLRRADQHPVHEWDHGLPQGRHPHPPQHPQQRSFRGVAAGVHRARPRVRAGAPVPLLRDGDGEPRGDLERLVHRLSGRGVRSREDARGLPPRALHEPVRRADDVHRTARPRALRRVRPELAAHRDHGGLARARSRS